MSSFFQFSSGQKSLQTTSILTDNGPRTPCLSLQSISVELKRRLLQELEESNAKKKRDAYGHRPPGFQQMQGRNFVPDSFVCETVDIFDFFTCCSCWFNTPEEEDEDIVLKPHLAKAGQVNRLGGLPALKRVVEANEDLGVIGEEQELLKYFAIPIELGLYEDDDGFLKNATPYHHIMHRFPVRAAYDDVLNKYHATRKDWEPFRGLGKEPCHVCFVGRGGQGKTVMAKKLAACLGTFVCTDSQEKYSDCLPAAIAVREDKVVCIDTLIEDEVGANGGGSFKARLFQVVNTNRCLPVFANLTRKGEVLDTHFYFTTCNGIYFSEDDVQGGMDAIMRRFHFIVGCEDGRFYKKTTLTMEEKGSVIDTGSLVREIISCGQDLVAKATRNAKQAALDAKANAVIEVVLLDCASKLKFR